MIPSGKFTGSKKVYDGCEVIGLLAVTDGDIQSTVEAGNQCSLVKYFKERREWWYVRDGTAKSEYKLLAGDDRNASIAQRGL